MKRGGFGPRATPLSHGNAPLKRTTSLPRGKGFTRNAPSLPRAPFRAGRGGGETPQRSRGSEVARDVRANVYERDGHACVRCGKAVGPGNRQLQHRVARGMGGRADHDRPSALILLCGFSATDPAGCHEHVERWRTEAQAGGYGVPMGTDPLKWAVRYPDGWYLLDDDGGRTPCEPWGGDDLAS